MHDDSPAGQAVADRTLAAWMDPSNFPEYKSPNDVEFERIVSRL